MTCEKAVHQSKNGIIIKLCVSPHAPQTVFPAGYNTWRHCIEIKIRAAAQDNKANTELINTLADYFHLSPNDIVLIHELLYKITRSSQRNADAPRWEFRISKSELRKTIKQKF